MSHSDIDVDAELERLFRVMREVTEPDAAARTRVRAALRHGIESRPALKPPTTSFGLKFWLLVGAGTAIALTVVALRRPQLAPERYGASVPQGAETLLVAPPPEGSAPAAPSDASSFGEASAASAPPRAVPTSALAAPDGASSTRAKARGANSAAVRDEVSLIADMQLSIRAGNMPKALALVEEHAQHFPSGALTQEREVGRAIARCHLASKAERRSVLEAYLQRYSGSPYAARVNDACTR